MRTSRATKGVLWVAAERFGQQAISAVVVIILARLLEPAEFGLVAMITIFISLSQSLADSGMAQALIRKKEITVDDRSTVFWFNLGVSLVMYALIFVSAPYIAGFYDQPKLIDLTRFMALSLPFSAISIVQRAELAQRLDFKKEALSQVPAMAIAGLISVILALNGAGVWALAAQHVILALLASALLWFRVRSEVRFIWSRAVFKEHFNFGYKLMLAGLMNTFFLDLNKLVIGKVFGANLLGFYAQARKLQDLSTKNLINIIQKATYPLLAQSDHKGDLLESYRKVVLLSSFIILPIALFLILMAEPIVVVVLGSKWLVSAEVLKITGISGLLYHLHSINLNVLKVLGRSDLFLKLEILKKSNTVIALVIGVPLGFEPMLWALVISSFVALIINTWYTQKLIGYGVVHQLKDVGQVFTMLLPFIVSVWVVGHYKWVNNILTLFLSMTAFALIYGLSLYIFKNETSRLVMEKLQPFFQRIR